MIDRDRKTHLWMSQQILVRLFADHDQLITTLRDMRAGYPGGGGGGNGSRPVTTSGGEDGQPEWDRTSAAAMAGDPASRHLDRLDAIVASVQRQVREAEWIRQYWLAEPAEPAAKAKMPSTIDPGCEACWRVGAWSPTHVESSTANGNLTEPRRLCRWCYDRVLQWGELPTRAECERHAKGQRVRRHGAKAGVSQ